MTDKREMSQTHKNALAKGRTEGRVVREYLEGLRATKPKRGRKRTAETIEARLSRVAVELIDPSPMDELLLIQERRDLEAELKTMDQRVDMTTLENAFADVAKSYSDGKKSSYASWRDVGVDAAVLKRAGIARSN
jgi:hypothetical protein